MIHAIFEDFSHDMVKIISGGRPKPTVRGRSLFLSLFVPSNINDSMSSAHNISFASSSFLYARACELAESSRTF